MLQSSVIFITMVLKFGKCTILAIKYSFQEYYFHTYKQYRYQYIPFFSSIQVVYITEFQLLIINTYVEGYLSMAYNDVQIQQNRIVFIYIPQILQKAKAKDAEHVTA